MLDNLININLNNNTISVGGPDWSRGSGFHKTCFSYMRNLLGRFSSQNRHIHEKIPLNQIKNVFFI